MKGDENKRNRNLREVEVDATSEISVVWIRGGNGGVVSENMRSGKSGGIEWGKKKKKKRKERERNKKEKSRGNEQTANCDQQSESDQPAFLCLSVSFCTKAMMEQHKKNKKSQTQSPNGQLKVNLDTLLFCDGTLARYWTSPGKTAR